MRGRKAKWPPPIYTRDGRDYVRLRLLGRARDVTLGPTGSAESRAEYARIVAERESGRLTADASPGVSVAEVCLAHLEWAHGYHEYRQYARIVRALRPVTGMYGAKPADTFGPLALKACRVKWVEDGLARVYCNRLATCVRQCFRWAAGEELVPSTVADALKCVSGLRKRKTEAPEVERVVACDLADVGLTLPQLPAIVASLVRLLMFTGARPGEACALRPQDLDHAWKMVDGRPWWLYRCDGHKTDWRGHHRWIPIGPAAQAVLLPYLERDPGAYCFSPREAAEAWLTAAGRRVHFRRRRAPGERYTTQALDRVIRRACARAGVSWQANQIRHAVATEIETHLGREDARCVLGHRNPQTTAIYADGVERAARALATIEGRREKGNTC